MGLLRHSQASSPVELNLGAHLPLFAVDLFGFEFNVHPYLCPQRTAFGSARSQCRTAGPLEHAGVDARPSPEENSPAGGPSNAPYSPSPQKGSSPGASCIRRMLARRPNA